MNSERCQRFNSQRGEIATLLTLIGLGVAVVGILASQALVRTQTKLKPKADVGLTAFHKNPVTPNSQCTTSITLTWSSFSPDSSYELYLVDMTHDWQQRFLAGVGKTTSFSYTNYEYNHTYMWRVFATDATGTRLAEADGADSWQNFLTACPNGTPTPPPLPTPDPKSPITCAANEVELTVQPCHETIASNVGLSSVRNYNLKNLPYTISSTLTKAVFQGRASINSLSQTPDPGRFFVMASPQDNCFSTGSLSTATQLRVTSGTNQYLDSTQALASIGNKYMAIETYDRSVFGDDKNIYMCVTVGIHPTLTLTPTASPTFTPTPTETSTPTPTSTPVPFRKNPVTPVHQCTTNILFTWNPYPQASAYELYLVDITHDWQQRFLSTVGNTLRYSFTGYEPNRRYQWRIFATDSAGNRMAEADGGEAWQYFYTDCPGGILLPTFTPIPTRTPTATPRPTNIPTNTPTPTPNLPLLCRQLKSIIDTGWGTSCSQPISLTNHYDKRGDVNKDGRISSQDYLSVDLTNNADCQGVLNDPFDPCTRLTPTVTPTSTIRPTLTPTATPRPTFTPTPTTPSTGGGGAPSLVFNKTAPADNAVVPYGPVNFSWSKYNDPAIYQYVVVFYNASGQVVYKMYVQGYTNTNTTFNLSSFSPFRPNETYTWQVFANDGRNDRTAADGQTGAPRHFRIAAATASVAPVCPRGSLGNLDCSPDACINEADFTLFKQNFGKSARQIQFSGNLKHTPDLYNDSSNQIDTADYEVFRSHFGTCQ